MVCAAGQAPDSQPIGPTTGKEFVERDPNNNAILHTNCVATLLNAGYATNALAQRATANVNCRIFPGITKALNAGMKTE
jgi:acetylornithine deacetylase/succinyl-diaminopimelate desuccinylase-like protein